MADAPAHRTERPPGDWGWFWGASDDGPLQGPFATEAEARDNCFAEDGEDAMHDARSDGLDPDPAAIKAGHEWIGEYRRPRITTDAFDAARVLEDMEEVNEVAVWGDNPPGWPDAARRDLELRLATALHDWMEAHGLWDQFRGLEGW